MDAYNGAIRHDDHRDADYEVHTSESFAASKWCATCLLEYIESGMGGCLQFVTQIWPAKNRKAKKRHKRVRRALKPLGIVCQQP
jgi:hypothetical protein